MCHCALYTQNYIILFSSHVIAFFVCENQGISLMDELICNNICVDTGQLLYVVWIVVSIVNMLTCIILIPPFLVRLPENGR